MGRGYVPPHLRGGRGAGASASARARGKNARDGDAAPANAEAVVAAALSSREAAERKWSRDGAVAAASTRDALAEVSRAIRGALEDATEDSRTYWTANPDKRHDAILALAECLSATASATLVAARVGPLVPTLLAAEAEASRAAVALYTESVEVFEGALATRERCVGAQAANERRDEDQTPPAMAREATASARASLANATAALGDVFASVDAHEHALPTLVRAERMYERVANDALEEASAAESAHEKTVAESATGDVDRRVAAQSAQSALQRRARASAACLDALWNLGDARAKLAECHAALGSFDDAASSRRGAFAAFDRAVSRADSAAGDDLGGLVYDWGCVLVAHAQTELERARCVATRLRSCDGAGAPADAAWGSAERSEAAGAVAAALAAAESATREAEERLSHAAEFSPGDVAPLVARGEAMQTRAETARRTREFVAFRDGGLGSNPGLADDAIATLRLAADASGGAFGAALRVDAKNFDATVGVAECRVEIGKTLVAARRPDVVAARAEFQAGWASYRAALELAGAGGAGNGAHVSGSDPGTVRDRLNVAYAAACAAHLAGESETCGEILANVLRCGGCTSTAIAADEDLVGLEPRMWGG